MPIRVTKYQDTPNPNALKCSLSGPLSDRPRSFRRPEDADGDPIAAALFAVPGVEGVLIMGDWMTINKRPDAAWPTVKAGVERTLRAIDHPQQPATDKPA